MKAVWRGALLVGISAFETEAFVLPSRRNSQTTIALASEPDSAHTTHGDNDTGRRDALRSLFGGALSLAAWEMGWSVASTNVGAIVERVMAFGTKYQGAAVASEELTAWIATQTVAKTPEIQAWLTAQKRLQVIRKATLGMTAAVTRSRTTKQAATAVAGIEESAVVAAASVVAARNVFKMGSCEDTAAANATADVIASTGNSTVIE